MWRLAADKAVGGKYWVQARDSMQNAGGAGWA